MCTQCVATAMTAAATATGARAYMAHRRFAWLTPTRLRRITSGLIGGAVLASAVAIG
jgi:hypothetical protein